MARQCPPGVICIENITILFLIVVIIGIVIFFHMKAPQANDTIQEKIYTIIAPSNSQYKHEQHKNINNLFNPYQPPMRMPINIRTQGNPHDMQYRQIGILTRNSGDDTILPLMGRPVHSHRDKWNFYTMNDKNNMIKLPVTHKGKSCTNEYGCDNIYNGDTVYVEGYNDTFKATVYDTETTRYIPYL